MSMDPSLKERIRSVRGESLITTADEAAKLIKDGMVLGRKFDSLIRIKQL